MAMKFFLIPGKSSPSSSEVVGDYGLFNGKRSIGSKRDFNWDHMCSIQPMAKFS